jgi:putative transposase
MAIPPRGSTGHGTYFITASCHDKKHLLQSDRSARLFIDVLYHYRAEQKYLVHEFVVMPNHFHLLITPAQDVTLERALQLIKGGFSYRAAREIALRGEIWQTSFYDHRIRNADEYQRCREYIRQNPVRRGLVARAENYPFSSANPAFQLDEVPQRLKPASCAASGPQG